MRRPKALLVCETLAEYTDELGVKLPGCPSNDFRLRKPRLSTEPGEFGTSRFVVPVAGSGDDSMAEFFVGFLLIRYMKVSNYISFAWYVL